MLSAKVVATEPENELLVSNVVARLDHCHSKSRALKADLDQFELQTQNAIELVSKFERQAEQLEGDLKKYFENPERTVKQFDSFEMIDEYEAKLEVNFALLEELQSYSIDLYYKIVILIESYQARQGNNYIGWQATMWISFYQTRV